MSLKRIYNQPQAVASVFTAALEEVKDEPEASKLLLARQFREALLRAGLFAGMSKAINSLHELHKVMPKELQDETAETTTDGLLDSGRQFLTEVYGDDQAKNIERALDTMSPRLGYYAVQLVYGGIYSDKQALSTKDACVLMYMCNMAVDTVKQAIGHIDSSKRQGATTEELLNVGMLSRSIGMLYDVKLLHWEQIMEAAESEARSDTNPYQV